MEALLNHLNRWKEFVSTPREELDGFPICPFAKNIDVVFDVIKSEETLLIDVLKRERSFEPLFMFVDFKGVLEYNQACSLVDFYNSISGDYQYFVDDSKNPQKMNGIDTSNGKYIIIIGQRNDILNVAREKLMNADYYKFLEKEYLKKIGVNLNEC